MPRALPASAPTRVARAAAAVCIALVTVVSSSSHAGAAGKVGQSQSVLCDGYTAGTCSVTTDSTVAAQDQLLRVSATGNPGAHLVLQFYVIEFNSRGELTGLVPSGAPVDGVTRDLGAGRGRLDDARLIPQAVADVPGGWGFVGLAADSSLDLSTRVGQVVEFGGRTLKLLGDRYAEQKPVGVSLSLHVLGNVPGVGYWVEYLADDGTWTPLPGHGYGAAQRLLASPGEISQLTYSVPTELTPGQPYRFRVNHHLNYGGAEDRPVADPAHAEWVVVPSEHGRTQPLGQQFDPTKAAGQPDPRTPGGGSGGGAGGGGATPPPASPPATSPAAPGGAPAPDPTQGDDAPAPAAPRPADGEQATPPPVTPSPAGSTGPTDDASSAGAAPSAAPAAPAPAGTATVWGDEPRADAAPRAGETPRPLTWSLTLALLGLVAAPGIWLWWRRRGMADRGESW
ncbi:hypothetical protein JK386_17925 [Nocardioides sp. zg-536]|uniref:Fibronectin type-III domain-containing protein n=1 Tax=Nocardioides faecalis TaxID=2803858 RepID=A0A938Y9N9_9ACTN|nr:hypothetical protein [Nocardioides faecalis]MBM9461774.1 hypothetical protein [Nocardioides faecalis]QVI57824.1 hypothetical protein KG111_12225 [Nocardioides faecalis]